MTARSLIIDLFGDYLRYRGGSARLRSITWLMSCFDVPESTVRVNVTRLQKDGWITRSRNGRESVYALTDAAWNMLDEGRDRIFNRTTRSWDSHWSMVIYSLPETQRALRETARKELTWLGFGRLANSVWINPHDRLHEAKQTLAHPEADLHLLHTRSAGGLAEDRAMAHTCWDLTGLAHDYDTFLQYYKPKLAHYRDGHVNHREAFIQRVLLVHNYRRFPYHDPDLPYDLLPEHWPGAAAHEVFLALHKLLRDPAERFVDAQLRTWLPTP